MKKLALSLLTAVIAASIPALASASLHHPVCHKVKVHGHWEKRCR